MTPRSLPIRLPRRLAIAGLAAVLTLAAGCKSKDGGNAAATKPRDPLVFGPTRIPQQNLPVPERGGLGTKGKTDPLIGSPTGRPGDKTGVGYSDDPERFKGTYIPSPSSTPAALAGKPRDSGELKIDDGNTGVPLQPTGGTRPQPAEGDPTTSVDTLFAELEKYGVGREDRSLMRDNGQYVFRATVPISGTGARRQYEGLGATAYEAVKGVLDNVIADRK
jgi:hypothetical protein